MTGQQAPGFPVSTSPELGLQMYATALDFYGL